MLVLRREKGESIMIGDDIVIKVLSIDGQHVRQCLTRVVEVTASVNHRYAHGGTRAVSSCRTS